MKVSWFDSVWSRVTNQHLNFRACVMRCVVADQCMDADALVTWTGIKWAVNLISFCHIIQWKWMMQVQSM